MIMSNIERNYYVPLCPIIYLFFPIAHLFSPFFLPSLSPASYFLPFFSYSFAFFLCCFFDLYYYTFVPFHCPCISSFFSFSLSICYFVLLSYISSISPTSASSILIIYVLTLSLLSSSDTFHCFFRSLHSSPYSSTVNNTFEFSQAFLVSEACFISSCPSVSALLLTGLHCTCTASIFSLPSFRQICSFLLRSARLCSFRIITLVGFFIPLLLCFFVIGLIGIHRETIFWC